MTTYEKTRWGGKREKKEEFIPVRRDSTGQPINQGRSYKEYLELYNIKFIKAGKPA